MKLTPADPSQAIRDDKYKSDTVSLIEYGLRDGCLQSEYDLASRLEELRGVALDLANELYKYGGDANSRQLQLIDVLVEKMVERRVTLLEK